jgi:N-acetylmuramoyl-L-alanine amidase
VSVLRFRCFAGVLLLAIWSGSSNASDFRLERIAIDAGHGGWDQGAVGSRGTAEKDITLAVALRLAKLLEERSPVRVYLTRQSDFYVPLRERTLIANRHRADLFLSIHCNAMEKRSSRGTEIYFCSEKASDKMAELVAERENAIAHDEELPEAQAGFVDIEQILFRLERKLYWEESAIVSKRIIERMIPQLKTMNRGVKSANFAVLRTAKMPAVLVELAFISNAEEEALLRSEAFQDRAARAIFEGLRPMWGD